MRLRILFLNPMGTDMYDKYMSDVMSPYANPDTDLVVRSLNDVPKTPFLPSPALFFNQLFQAVIQGEKDGFDGVVVGCCADPAVRDSKDLVNIPVTGPFEAAVRTSPAFGRLGVVAPQINGSEDENLPETANWARALVREYQVDEYVATIRSAQTGHPSDEDTTRLFAEDPDALRELVLGGMETSMRTTAKEQAKAALVEDEASVLFFSCTLWGGMTGLIAEELEAVILDPVITPLKYVELLAAQNKY